LFSLQVSEIFYLRNPHTTALGKKMIAQAIEMIDDVGYSQFTFKKLALSINSVEASIYRYFENKEHMLFYLVATYWTATNFRVKFYTQMLKSHEERLFTTIDVLTGIQEASVPGLVFDRYEALQRIARKNYFYALTILKNKENGEVLEKELFRLSKEIQDHLEASIKKLAPSFTHSALMADTIMNKGLYSREELRSAGLPMNVEGYKQMADFLKEVLSHLR